MKVKVQLKDQVQRLVAASARLQRNEDGSSPTVELHPSVVAQFKHALFVPSPETQDPEAILKLPPEVLPEGAREAAEARADPARGGA